MSADTSTDPPFRRLTDLRCRSCGYSISAYADMPTRCPMCSAERPWAARSRPYAGRAEPRDSSSGRPGKLEIDVAHAPVKRAPVHVAHAHRHPVADELRQLRDIEHEGQSPATPLIMAGSVWIVAAVIVLLVTAAVYLAVQLGL
jgi:hypothetical protein